MTVIKNIHPFPNRQSTAEHIWNFQWSDFLPYPIDNGLTIELVTWKHAQSFIKAHYAEIYNEQERSNFFGSRESHDVKNHFYETVADCFFVFTEHGDVAALALGNIVDWSTYYFRNMSIRPEYQGKGIYPRFSHFLFDTLYTLGVERVEGDISPSNQQHLHIVNKLGWLQTGCVLTDRWGAFLRITKFLSPQAEGQFQRSFCGTEPSDSRQKIRRSNNTK